MRILARLGMLGAVLLVLGGAGGFWLLRYETPPAPALPGTLHRGHLDHGGRTRAYTAYVPSTWRAGGAVVLVLHGSRGEGARARAAFGYAFDALAERERFLAVYPDGYARHWNGCRRAGPYAANLEDVDDVGFLLALAEHLGDRFGADPGRLFATGISNGGHMALRLALEVPRRMRAVAPVIASLPTDANLDCTRSGEAVPLLLMNGTEDPMNPWEGGRVALYGVLGDRGPVRSASETVDYFRGLAGLDGEARVEPLPDADPTDGTRVVRHGWGGAGGPEVVLLAVEGGGHTVPHPAMRMPRLLGRTSRDLVAAEEIVDFFGRHGLARGGQDAS